VVQRLLILRQGITVPAASPTIIGLSIQVRQSLCLLLDWLTFWLLAVALVVVETLAEAVVLVNTFLPQVYIYPLPLIQSQ
jgi:hypothetical protein